MWGNFAKIHAISVSSKQQGITDGDMALVGERFGIGNARYIIAYLREILKKTP